MAWRIKNEFSKEKWFKITFEKLTIIQFKLFSERRRNHSRMGYNTKTSKILQDWFEKNQSNPYATKYQKTELAELTSLTAKQVSTWLINARQKLKSERLNSWLNSILELNKFFSWRNKYNILSTLFSI